MSTATLPPDDAEEARPEKELSLGESLRVLFSASRGFWLMNMVNFGDGIAYFGILGLLTLFLGTRIGLSDQATHASVSAFTGMVTLFMFGGGYVSDYFGVRRALTLSLLVIGLGRLCLVLSPGMGGADVAWTGLLLMALGTGVLQPALYAGVKEYTDERTATIGYGLLYSIMNLGIVAENFISPWIRTGSVFADNRFMHIVGLGWGIDGVYWVCTAITGFMLLTHLTFFTRRVEQAECRALDVVKDELKRTWQERLRELPILDPRFMFFIFILLPVRTLFAHQFLTIPQYVMRCYPEEVGNRLEWLTGINPLIIVVAVPLVAAITRKVKVIDMMIAGTTLTALTTFLLAGGPSLSALIWYMVLFSLGEALWASRFLEYVADLAPTGKVGAYMGLAGIPWFLAKFTTGLYSGVMLAHFVPEGGPQDSATLWLIYGFIACISPVGLILARRWIKAGAHTSS